MSNPRPQPPEDPKDALIRTLADRTNATPAGLARLAASIGR